MPAGQACSGYASVQAGAEMGGGGGGLGSKSLCSFWSMQMPTGPLDDWEGIP